MNDRSHYRNALGFVLEGRGEYVTYPSFVNRICGFSNFYVPRSQTGGIGRILKNPERYLSDLIKAYRPRTVIVAFDLKDAFEQTELQTCAEVKQYVLRKCEEWRAQALHNPKLQPLPEKIEVVLQVQKLESWLVVDTERLARHASFPTPLPPHTSENVDEEVAEPEKWLQEHAEQRFNPKKPREIKKAFAMCRVEVIETGSRSFAKLAKEVRLALSV